MTEPIWLPLQGPTGERPKAPSVAGWQSPGYEGVPLTADVPADRWLGMRTDGWVVVDCDSPAAAKRWRKIAPAKDGWVRKTPRGFHFIYRQAEDSPDGPRVDVFGGGSGIDIRAGRTSQIVFYAEGYRDIQGGPDDATLFRKAWIPAQRELLEDAEEWTEMPDGRGNNTMAALAGAMRRQGMSAEVIYASLKGINKLTMTREPMPDEMIRQIAQSVARYTPDPDIDIEFEDDEAVSFDDAGEVETYDQSDKLYLDARRMELPPPAVWAWRPYLPQSRLIMLDGEEGIGKGMFCAWAAVNVAAGRAFPGGADDNPPRPVVWYTAEDDPQEDIYRRLLAAGYDPAVHAAIYFRNPRQARLKFPANISHVRQVCDKLKPALIVFDPGRSYLAPENENQEMSFNNEAALRPGLEQLMYMAHDQQVCTIFVHHWNKMSEGSTRTKSGGSGAFQQVVRHKITVAQVGDKRALSVEKSNITDRSYTVRSYDVEPMDEYDTARFVVGGALPLYRGLDEWIETVRKLEAENGPEIVVTVDWLEACWHYSTLAIGALAPVAADIAHDLDVSLEDARTIRSRLKDEGVIDGRTNRWNGQPAGNRYRSEVEPSDD